MEADDARTEPEYQQDSMLPSWLLILRDVWKDVRTLSMVDRHADARKLIKAGIRLTEYLAVRGVPSGQVRDELRAEFAELNAQGVGYRDFAASIERHTTPH